MPIPQPAPGEERDAFVARCMAHPLMREDFSNLGLRATVCFEKWREELEQAAVRGPSSALQEAAD